MSEQDSEQGMMPPESGPVGAACSTHPDRRASITCPHCGSYACGECTVDTLWGDVMCEECRRRGRAQYPLPWEQGASPVSFVQTAYLLFAEAGPCFSALPRGSVLRALGFAASVSLLLALTTLFADWVFAPRHWASEAPDPLVALLRALALHGSVTGTFLVVVSSVFHVAATLLGGRAPLSTALRAASYLTVIQLLELVVRLLDSLVAFGTPVSLIVRLVGAFFLVWSLSLVAQHRYGLSKARAVTAGLAPAALLLLLVFALLIALAA